MGKKIWHVCIILYVLLAVLVTLCLLTYNEYNVTEFGNKLLVMVENDTTGKFNNGDLIIVNKTNKVKEKDNVFYYVLREKNYYINYGTVEVKKKDSVTIHNEVIDNDLIIGSDSKATVIPLLGGILSLLESKWGYLCIVILPILIAFLIEVYSIVKELKGVKK